MNEVRINTERCKECGYCIRYCPKGCLKKGDAINKRGYYAPVYEAANCIGCGICAQVCPDTVLTVYKDTDKE